MDTAGRASPELVFSLRRVTESAALAAFNWIGRGDGMDGGRAALDAMRSARGGRPDGELCDGPGKLCQALGISGGDDGADVCDPAGRLRLERDDVAAPERPVATTRVGISRAVDRPWRFVVPGHRGASRPRPPAVAG